ncbi:MAG: hypothetical protein ACP5O6_10180 [Candidatus Baltobacteraceae bacterium]
MKRPHKARSYTHGYFAALAEEAGLPFRGGGTREEHLEILQNPDINHPLRGIKAIADIVDCSGQSVFDAMEAGIAPGETIIVNSVLAFAARSVSEFHGVPVETVYLQPIVLRDSPDIPQGGVMLAAWHGALRLLKKGDRPPCASPNHVIEEEVAPQTLRPSPLCDATPDVHDGSHRAERRMDDRTKHRQSIGGT